MKTYILAPKRGAIPPQDWKIQVKNIDGVTPTTHSGRLMFVTATPEGLAELTSQLGQYLHIERPIERTAQ